MLKLERFSHSRIGLFLTSREIGKRTHQGKRLFNSSFIQVSTVAVNNKIQAKKSRRYFSLRRNISHIHLR